ncbi:hypothetical protein WJX72_007944 [[Myrmecia] bisecta]|uniref:G-patch domain-containing protein n=1 Tax=[Myrmecia] bisecta TaxID=41462 RepID=A0AAW1PGZ1_9CHLO
MALVMSRYPEEFVHREEATTSGRGLAPEQFYRQVTGAHCRNHSWSLRTRDTEGSGKESSAEESQRVPQYGQHTARPGQQADLPTNNIGFKLLKQAGWREGTGLGAAEQGRLQPIQAWQQHGRAGIGVRLEAQPPQQHPLANNQPRPPKTTAGKKRKGLQPIPTVEDDPGVKLQRVRQVWQSEVDESAGKAIQAYIYRAFNDATGEPGPDDNPLLRNHKLSATNPLL